jgi:hypothetical protein
MRKYFFVFCAAIIVYTVVSPLRAEDKCSVANENVCFNGLIG